LLSYIVYFHKYHKIVISCIFEKVKNIFFSQSLSYSTFYPTICHWTIKNVLGIREPEKTNPDLGSRVINAPDPDPKQ
jgi:hypothetical protein